jgi:hypothetical protein
MEGYDDVWRESIADRASYFFTLPPGKYTYRVKAYNAFGAKAEKAINRPEYCRRGGKHGGHILFTVCVDWACCFCEAGNCTERAIARCLQIGTPGT